VSVTPLPSLIVQAQIAKAIASKPELVQISTAYGTQKDGSPVLPRNRYVAIRDDRPQSKEEAKRPEFKECKFTTEAIITEGTDVGTIHKVCTSPTCPIHHPKQTISRDDEKWKAEQAKQRKEEAIANTTGVRVLAAISAAVPVRLLKRDLLFAIERLLSVMDDNRVEMLARQHGIRQKRDDGGIKKSFGRLVAQVDILFISHLHPDHANQQMAELFIRAGKPVIVPPGLWSDQPFAKGLTFPDRSPNRTIPITANHKTIRVVVYPGHQGPVLNNVYFLTFPGGFAVLHTGDQDLPQEQGEDRTWLNGIGNEHHVNVLLVDGWYANLVDLIASVRPDLVIPGHEDELSHVVPHREGYDQTYERLSHSSRPFAVMTWGESLSVPH
jgi:glyoxylase-like metal-dependent hydrolase (beta-lactamase superfamily II)